jgi:Flp pilus assembly protein TadG
MATLIRALRRFGRAQSGAEIIEFALTLPLLLLVVLGIIEFGFLFQQYEVVTNAAREGARIAVLPTYSANATATEANVRARVNQYLTAGGLSTASATICGGGGTCPGDWLSVTDTIVAGPPCLAVKVFRVTVEYQHPVAFVGGILSYFGKSVGTAGVITLRATSRMRNEVPASACS